MEFTNFYFREEFKGLKQRATIIWKLGGVLSDGAAGRTHELEHGRILIEIATKTFGDAKLLYLTVGHELIHADDLTNGNYDKWFKSCEQRVTPIWMFNCSL